MFNPGLKLVLGLCMASLLPSTFNPPAIPPRDTIIWDVSPQDLEQDSTGTWSQCSCRPGPSEQLLSSTQLCISLASLEMACWSCSALYLLLCGLLLLRRLCRKAKRCPREELGHTPSASPGTCCHGGDLSCEDYQLVCWLNDHPEFVNKYLR